MGAHPCHDSERGVVPRTSGFSEIRVGDYSPQSLSMSSGERALHLLLVGIPIEKPMHYIIVELPAKCIWDRGYLRKEFSLFRNILR